MESIHIIYNHFNKTKKWAVIKKPLQKKALKLETYREIAFLYACNIAKKGQTVYVHRKDGTVEFEFEITNE